jgi:hypothetical protein
MRAEVALLNGSGCISDNGEGTGLAFCIRGVNEALYNAIYVV